MTELAAIGRDPDAAVIAALEIEADNRDLDLDAVLAYLHDAEEDGDDDFDREVNDLLAAAEGLIAARVFNPDLHPRGRDGKFIHKFGIVKLFDVFFNGKDGGTKYDGRRAKVLGINPDPKNPGKPKIRVGVLDKDDKPSVVFDVTPDKVEMAPEKARLKSKLPDVNAP